jgi:uncharacterized repeat protein (TIGR02543 family)
MPAAAVTITANWEPIPPTIYTVTFVSDGVMHTTRSVANGGLLGELPVQPTKTGHSFAGWWTDVISGKLVDENHPVEDHLTLHARWNINVYTVSFVSVGGSVVTPLSINHGQSLGSRFPTPQRAGYRFDGWFTQAGASVTAATPISSGTTLTARWTATSAMLKSLKVTGGKFNRAFVDGTATYTVTIPKKRGSTTVSAGKQNKAATVEFKIKGKWKKVNKQKVSLKPGKSTTVSIRVKQKGMKTMTYKVKVVRAKK